MGQTIKTITLYCQDSGSDKVYMLQLDHVEGGYMVYYGNGKRGATLKPKAITPSPVTLEEATKIYASKEAAKRKGKRGKSIYKESPDGGNTLEINDDAGKNSGIEVQLLNKITKEEALRLCTDPAWVAQEKHDGERRPVIVKDGTASGTNRYGEFTGGMRTDVANGINTSIDMVVDTEDLGTYLAAFDLLEYNGQDLRSLPFIDRYTKLTEIADANPSLRISTLAVTTEEKQALFARVTADNGEGLVFKRANASFTAGRPNSGGDQLKFKLYDEASVIVMKINTKRSFQMGVLDENGDPVLVGNCTIPANQPIPAVGDVIEVSYLYAYQGGSLFQPTYNKARSDQRQNECKQSQLKYKPAAVA